MFWRPGKGEYRGQWHGPARVIIQESDRVVWISFSSRVYRVAPEHIRSLSLHEVQQSMEQLATSRMDFPEKIMVREFFNMKTLLNRQVPQVFPKRKNQRLSQLCHCLQSLRQYYRKVTIWNSLTPNQICHQHPKPAVDIPQRHRSMIEFPII